MRKIILLILPLMWLNLFAQKVVYNSNGKKIDYLTEDMDIEFTKSDVATTEMNLTFAPLLTALLPSVIDLGFKVATKSLEKREKKFSGEYVVQKSYLQDKGTSLPKITFYRKLDMDGTGAKNNTGLRMVIVPRLVKVNESTTAVIYWVDSLSLHHSKAKAKGDYMDYLIEIQPTFIVDGEKKSQELFPITIPSVTFNRNKLPAEKYRTDLILVPKKASLAEMSVKIVETNPERIKTGKVLALLNDYGEDAKTIINNFIPKAKE
ncbi:MAG: hypothetical protein DI538_14515 [Azospira oryzae]|nr:MAG: hypothetical protein DI538_14515 [Azospira oryzae]